jgi:hypothetical protein
MVEAMSIVAQPEDLAQRIARLRVAGHEVFLNPDGTFERSELNAICALWREKAKGGLPARTEFGLRDLAPFLRHVAILERTAAGRYRYRFYGSALVAMTGEGTNRFLDEHIPAEHYAATKADFDLILAHGEPLRFVIEYRSPRLDYLYGESFAAALASPAGPPATILGATYLKAKVGGKSLD